MPVPVPTTQQRLRSMSIRTAQHKLDILVVGAGIAGLACAYALVQAGHTVRVIERSSSEEWRVGGIGIPPNMHKTLVEWGLGPQLEKAAQQCRGSTFHLLATGEKVGYLGWKEEVVRESGGEFLLIYHAELHKMLRDLVIQAGASITYDTQVTQVTYSRPSQRPLLGSILTPQPFRLSDPAFSGSGHSDLEHSFARSLNGKSTWDDAGNQAFRPRVHLASGRVLEADLVVGADGFNSVVRKYVCDAEAIDTDMSILTLTIPAGQMKQQADLAGLLDLPECLMWMGTSRSVLSYSMRQGQEYCVHLFWPDSDILPGDDNTHMEGCDFVPTDRIATHGCDPLVQRLARMVPNATRAKLVNRRTAPDWVDEHCKIILLGEAAHPVMPCSIYGPSLGVEDAAVLGVLLSRLRTKSQIPMLLEAYQDLRLPRCQAISASELVNASLVWLPPGPARDARDAAMRASLEEQAPVEGQSTDTKLREQYERIAGVFGYNAREAAENWWVQWGGLGESSQGGIASLYEPHDLQFSIKETTTMTPGWKFGPCRINKTKAPSGL